MNLVKIKLGVLLLDIVILIRFNELVYVDCMDEMVNILKNLKIWILIRYEGWIFYFVCIVFFYELLVVMKSIDKIKMKVVCYFGLELK